MLNRSMTAFLDDRLWWDGWCWFSGRFPHGGSTSSGRNREISIPLLIKVETREICGHYPTRRIEVQDVEVTREGITFQGRVTAGYNVFGNNRRLGSKKDGNYKGHRSDPSEWPPDTQATEHGTNVSISQPRVFPQVAIKVKDQSGLNQQGNLFGLIDPSQSDLKSRILACARYYISICR